MNEKLNSEAKLRSWPDHIPLEWKYTAGVAGDRFLRLLMQGKIQASYCKNCDKLYLPPKIFCKDCFAQLNEWRDVPDDTGTLYTFTTVRKGDHESDDKTETIALVRFEGVDGGILGRLKVGRDEKPRIGMKVKPAFKAKNTRIGDLSDIEYFEKILEAPK